MSYEMLAQNSTWTNNTVKFVSGEEAHKYFKFMRTAIMDAHLIVHKPIGFTISKGDTTHANGERHIYLTEDPEDGLSLTVSRNTSIGESNLSLVNIFRHWLLPLDINGTVFSMYLKAGESTLDNPGFVDEYTSTPVPIISGDRHVVTRVVSKYSHLMKLSIYTRKSSGRVSMADASNLLPDHDIHGMRVVAFPMNTVFDINEYIRILPHNENDPYVHYTLHNGMTPEELSNIFTYYINYIQKPGISKEETEWIEHL